ncbi:MAG: M48 family metallopeptidase [Planctomycetota bacterium]
MSIRLQSLLFLLLAGAMCLPACQTNPVTGRSSLNMVPDSTLNSLGAQGYQEVLSKEPLSRDARKTEIVRRVAQRIAAVSPVQMDWEISLIESNQANAFVLPGGKIVVYTGILPICETEAGLAFVLGHEVGHAVAKHGGERMTQSLLIQGGLTAASLSLGDSQNAPMIMGALGLGAQYGVALPFSRSHESEADEMGILFMAEAGYDPRVAPDLWVRMGQASGGQAPPEFTSTHPANERRTRDLQGHMDQAMKIYDASAKKYGVGVKL